jgi:ubiquinone biosynthesis protein
MSILQVPMTIRSTQRLGQIAMTLTRHGFGHIVGRLKLRRYIPWSGRFKRFEPSPAGLTGQEPSLGRRMVAMAEELGPTFVKLGQMLSSRPDLISPELMDDLRTLQDQVTPFPTEQAYEIIRKDFKRDIKQLYSEFESVPLASGSIAQTYLARTHDGEKVVVKVRRPHIEHTIKLDMYLLEKLAANIERHMPELRPYRPIAFVQEFAKTLLREIDFLNEASVTDHIHAFFKHDPRIVIPDIRWDLTSNRVMTMTYVSGQKFFDATGDPTLVLDRQKLGNTLVETFIQQVLELGTFHADLHPGNMKILPPDRLGLVDFGMAGQIDPNRRIAFIMLLTAGYYRYMDMVVDILSEMDAISPETDVDMLKRDLTILLDKLQSLPLEQMNFNMVFNDIASLARENHVILPRDFVMMGKSLVMVGGTSLLLNPSMKITDVVAGKVRQALTKLIGSDNLKRETILAAWHGGLLIRDLPHQMREIGRKLIRGQLRTKLDVVQMESLTQELDRSSNRLSAAIIVGSLIIGSSTVFNTNVGPNWYGIPLLGLTGYVVAGIMGLWLVIAILRSGKLS